MRKNEKNEKDLLQDIKSLLVVIAGRLGAKSEEIGRALGITGGQVRKMRSGQTRGEDNGSD